jgi:hypothetical protein
VIVVVGILLAFQITEWADQHQNKEVKAQYLSQLVEDLKKDAVEAERIERIALLRMAAINDLFDASRQEGVSARLDTDSWEFDSYEAFDVEKSGLHTGAILDMPRFFAVQDTFSALVSNGDFKLLDSPLLVRQIQGYYAATEQANGLEDALWRTFWFVSESRVRNGLLASSPTEFEDFVAALRDDSRMRSEFEMYWGYSGWQILWMNDMKQMGTELIEAIQAAE